MSKSEYIVPEMSVVELEEADVLTLSNNFTDDDILVCAQSDDALNRPLSTYNYASLRILHILGARVEFDTDTAFQNLLDGTSLPQ